MTTCYHCGDYFYSENHSACTEALSDLVRDVYPDELYEDEEMDFVNDDLLTEKIKDSLRPKIQEIVFKINNI